MNRHIETTSVDQNALRHQEILFTLVMSFVAALGRLDPNVRFPDILWGFAGMLSFNLAYHRLLRSRAGSAVPLVSMAVNAGLITLIVGLSGGARSGFWPLYLLPIFTGCLYLERRHVVGVCATAGAFLSCFYLEEFWDHRCWEACEFLLKLCVLGVSAAVTSQLSFKERAQAKALERRTTGDLQSMKKQTLDALIPGIVHALNNPLGVILGSVELMLEDAPEGTSRRRDLERVRAAARRCARIGEDLQAYAQAQAAAR